MKSNWVQPVNHTKEKKVEHIDCKCKFKCKSNVSKDDRESLMMSFYSLD